MKQPKDLFLVAFHPLRAKAGVKTSVKGWMNNPDNLQYTEQVEITRGKKNNIGTASIVLNLSTKQVDRNTLNDDRDFKSMFKYFFSGYHKYITAVMTQLDPEFMVEIIDELQAEMDAAETESPAENT